MNKIISLWEPIIPTSWEDIKKAREMGYEVEWAMGKVWFIEPKKDILSSLKDLSEAIKTVP